MCWTQLDSNSERPGNRSGFSLYEVTGANPHRPAPKLYFVDGAAFSTKPGEETCFTGLPLSRRF